MQSLLEKEIEESFSIILINNFRGLTQFFV